jgi:hypothetical protein
MKDNKHVLTRRDFLRVVKGKTKLVLVDSLYPLCDKGPQPDPRYQWPYNGLIAGTDPVAVETVCLNIITADLNQNRYMNFNS